MTTTHEIIEPVASNGSNLATVQPRELAPSPTIETIIQSAMALPTIPIDAIERLVALKERELDRRAEQEFNEALSAFRAECPAIIKVKTASFPTKGGGKMQYNYAPLEEVTKTVDPVLFRHGLTYHWDARFDSKPPMIACTVHHVGGHKRTSCFPCDTSGGGPSSQSPSQAMASAITFARRYALILALGITTDEDDDARRPTPGAAPDRDPTAPRVTPRDQRTSADPNVVTAAELNELFKASKFPTVAEFAAWAKGKLGVDLAMDKVAHWNRDSLEYCYQELEGQNL